MESFVRRCAVSLLSLAVVAAPAAAQSSRYVRLTLGSAALQPAGARFPSPGRVSAPALAVGYVSPRGHGVELRVSRMSAETMEFVYPTIGNDGQATTPPSICCGGEAPYTVGVTATPVELGYFYQPSLLGGALRPRVGVGGVAAHVVDRWRSDTPTEHSGSWELGASASAGLAVRIAGPASLVANGGYQRFSDAGSRPARHVGLSGRRLGVGLELGF